MSLQEISKLIEENNLLQNELKNKDKIIENLRTNYNELCVELHMIKKELFERTEQLHNKSYEYEDMVKTIKENTNNQITDYEKIINQLEKDLNEKIK